MKQFRRMGLSLMLAVVLLVSFTVPAMAQAGNPTVALTVTAEVIAITNSINTWAIGNVATTATVYFSADGNADPDYSRITNTGSVAVSIEIRGTNFVPVDTTYTWTLAADGNAGNQIYGLKANTEATPTTYDVLVKSSAYVDLTTDLAAAATYDWSMEFKGPTAFHAADDGLEKDATVTLVARKYP